MDRGGRDVRANDAEQICKRMDGNRNDRFDGGDDGRAGQRCCRGAEGDGFDGMRGVSRGGEE